MYTEKQYQELNELGTRLANTVEPVLRACGSDAVGWREPDMGDRLTAIATRTRPPGDWELL